MGQIIINNKIFIKAASKNVGSKKYSDKFNNGRHNIKCIITDQITNSIEI